MIQIQKTKSINIENEETSSMRFLFSITNKVLLKDKNK